MHKNTWPAIAQFGFIVSAVGLGTWIVGGSLNAFGLQSTEPPSVWGRFVLQLIAQPQPGWGLFGVGLIPIGFAAIRRRLSLPMQLLLPLGCLFILGEPLKYLLGERMGGLTVLIGFGVGWLAICTLLLSEASESEPASRTWDRGDSLWHNPRSEPPRLNRNSLDGPVPSP